MVGHGTNSSPDKIVQLAQMNIRRDRSFLQHPKELLRWVSINGSNESNPELVLMLVAAFLGRTMFGLTNFP